MQNNDNDIKLFIKLKEGDKNALNKLFAKYYVPICHYVDTFVKEEAQTEEIVTDIFLMLWSKREKIKISFNFKAYLYSIAKNFALAHLRKKKVYFENIEDYHHDIKFHSEATSRIDCPEFKTQVDTLLEKIPPQSRKVLVLHRLEGFKYKEIAENLGISVKTVENHMGKAIRILKENKYLFEKLLKAFSLLYYFVSQLSIYILHF